MEEILEQAFINYQNIYENILISFYPSLGSTGFQERNLTVNFSKAYEKACDNENVISWFELQFGENKNNHLDCVIVNISRKEIFIIESKRFTSSNKKSSILKDIERIELFLEPGLDSRFKDFKDFAIFGVILADLWKENKPKKEIYRSYVEKNYFKDQNLNKYWSMYDVRDISIKREDYEAEYSLLSFLWEIKK